LCVNIAYCVLHTAIVWLGSVAKTINLHSYGTPYNQKGISTDPFCGGPRSCLPQILILTEISF